MPPETDADFRPGIGSHTETLIVWTEPQGTDMALSFQEPEGCAAIWYSLSLSQTSRS